MKKIIALLTAILVLIFSFSAGAVEINFTDVKTDDWFYKNLQELTEKNIISGYMDSTFKPGNTLKFEEFIKMLVVAVEKELVSQKGEHEWYQIYIDKAIESKYITEQQKSLIGQNIDRVTMAEILYNVLSNTKGVEQFDTDKIEYLKTLFSDLTNDDIKTLTIAGMGLICGYPDGTYKPNDSLKRSETVAVISRLIDKEQRLPVDFTKMDDVVVTPPSDITLDELPKVDLSHLYDYPTLLGSTVKEENISNNKWVNTDVIAADYTDYMELTHNRDYTTISKKATQYKQDLLYYLNGYKEYKGKKYYLLQKNELEYYTSSNNQEMIDYVLSKDDYIEFFLDKWVQDTIDNKVKVQAKFYTSDKLVIKADAVQAVRGTLRFKYDSHDKPANIKEELDLVERNIKVKGQGILNLDESKYNIYMEYNEIPNFQVGKWYEIDMDIVVANTAFTKGLEEKASHSYRYIYPIEVRELN
nr:S-layer homology domain-containing protein [Sedimentibacter sp.]